MSISPETIELHEKFVERISELLQATTDVMPTIYSGQELTAEQEHLVYRMARLLAKHQDLLLPVSCYQDYFDRGAGVFLCAERILKNCGYHSAGMKHWRYEGGFISPTGEYISCLRQSLSSSLHEDETSI